VKSDRADTNHPERRSRSGHCAPHRLDPLGCDEARIEDDLFHLLPYVHSGRAVPHAAREAPLEQSRRAGEDEARHPLSVRQRHLQRHVTAQRVAADNGFRNVEGVQEPDNVTADLLDGGLGQVRLEDGQ